MNTLDLIVLGILLGSGALGLMRGLVREAFSLAAWVLAFVAARLFAPLLAPMLPGGDNPAIQHAAALLLVFVATVFGMGLAGRLLAGLLHMAGLGPMDRGLGLTFGLVRGLAAVVGLTLVASLTALPQTPMWQTSLSHPYLESSARALSPWLPEDVSRLMRQAVDPLTSRSPGRPKNDLAPSGGGSGVASRGRLIPSVSPAFPSHPE